MATRSGDLDPAVLLFLLRSGMNADELEHTVNHQCGLTGISGGESDMQALQRHAGAGDTVAALAIESFCTAVRKSIGSYAALMGGIDLLVFTGGIGQHSAELRSRMVQGVECLGIRSDGDKVRAMGAEEEIQIARHCRAILA